MIARQGPYHREVNNNDNYARQYQARVPQKECLVCGKTKTYRSRLKESFACIALILWREYDGMVVFAECFTSIMEA